MPDIKISEELLEFVESNPHVQEVYFTKDGNYYLNAYENNGKLYSKLSLDAHGNPDNDGLNSPNEIVAQLTRNEILATEVGHTLVTEEHKTAFDEALSKLKATLVK